jgi:FAD/FMN-containing dehydrogenase/Fe-S oxidoreductase
MDALLDLKAMAKSEGMFSRPHRNSSVDAKELEARLRRKIRGEVRFDDGSRALYATDGSNYRQVPIGVVIPRDAEDVVETVALARSFGAPILARGCGTSLAGQCCNVAVVMDFSKYMHRILEIDEAARTARIQPGVILDHLRDATEHHDLTFGPDPSTHSHCTLGGMMGNNSCGVHSVYAGKTDDNVLELDVLTYDGCRMTVGKTSDDEFERILRAGGRQAEIYRKLKAMQDRYGDLIREKFPDLPRRVSGYNLPYLLPENGFDVAKLLVGSECTCATILEATVRLVYSPPARSLLVLGYPDIYSAGDHVMEVLAQHPIGLEVVDECLVTDMKKKKLHPEDVALLPEGEGWLLVEFGGESKKEADDKARSLMETLKKKSDAPSMKLFDNRWEERMVWLVRESGLGATARVPGEPDTWEGWEDSAVPPEKLGGYLRDLRKLFNEYGYACALYGHFGQGCVHTRIDFDLKTAPGIAKFRSFLNDAAELVVSYGGSISGEHGDGQSKAAMLPIMFGDEMIRVFNEFKSIWDPDWKMNPGKIVDPYQPDENLRYGADYRPSQVETRFRFPDDRNSFSYATERCVGVGNCRQTHGGVMCPSFQATREEKHSTRGRARMLFEMMQGDPLKEGWKSEAVKESLDLCLSCKGCKGECPVNVDMATYKAEFLSHYYEGKLRPAAAYALGLIPWWARLASYAPWAANFVSQTPPMSEWMKRAAGIASERRLPRFADRSFQAWFKDREPKNDGNPKVLLWPDTFNNYFFPETAQAATRVLEAAGFQVIAPEKPVCCGRPLYDWGMLDLAKKTLRRTLETLRPVLNAGIPVVGLEPSCVSVFRDEMTNLMPNDEDAIRMSRQTLLLSEFLARKAPDFHPPKLHRKAILQGHCHHRSLMKMDAEEEILKALGLDLETPETGCCGMAGAFGFEKGDHYNVSMTCGERSLLPAVRNASPDALVVADGFSCREQIAQGSGRRALHLAEVIDRALQGNPSKSEEPERAAAPGENGHRRRPSGKIPVAVLLGGAALAAAGAAWALNKRK